MDWSYDVVRRELSTGPVKALGDGAAMAVVLPGLAVTCPATFPWVLMGIQRTHANLDQRSDAVRQPRQGAPPGR